MAKITSINKSITTYTKIRDKIDKMNDIIHYVNQSEKEYSWVEETERKIRIMEQMIIRYEKLGTNRKIVLNILYEAMNKVEERILEKLKEEWIYTEFEGMLDSIKENKEKLKEEKIKEEENQKIKIKIK